MTGLTGGLIAQLVAGPGLKLDLGGSLVLSFAIAALCGIMTTLSVVRVRRTGSFSATTSVAALFTSRSARMQYWAIPGSRQPSPWLPPGC